MKITKSERKQIRDDRRQLLGKVTRYIARSVPVYPADKVNYTVLVDLSKPGMVKAYFYPRALTDFLGESMRMNRTTKQLYSEKKFWIDVVFDRDKNKHVFRRVRRLKEERSIAEKAATRGFIHAASFVPGKEELNRLFKTF